MNHLAIAPGIERHTELNPRLWHADQSLRPAVREKLLEIAAEFFDYVAVPVGIYDVVITGSQCSYGYTAYSDLDLHIIVDYDAVDCEDSVRELFDTKRRLWAKNHMVTVKGVNVEPYVEDLAQPARGSSYSLTQDRWLVKPQRLDQPLPDNLEPLITAWVRVITAAIKLGQSDKLEQIKFLLKQFRTQALARGGELDPANIAYKSLRNMGVLADLMTATNRIRDRELSLKEQTKY